MWSQPTVFAYLLILTNTLVFPPMIANAGIAMNGLQANGWAANGVGSNSLPSNGLSFNGAVDIHSFSVVKDRLSATVTVKATVNKREVNQRITIPVKIVKATCDILNLQFRPHEFDYDGMTLKLYQLNHSIAASKHSINPSLSKLLCSIAKMIDSRASLKEIAEKLNEIQRI